MFTENGNFSEDNDKLCNC